MMVIMVDHHFRKFFRSNYVTLGASEFLKPWPNNLEQGAGVFASSRFESG